jgi:hypothetical protein
MEKIIVKKQMTDAQAEALKFAFLTDDSYDQLISRSVDVFDTAGLLVAKFRTGVMPYETLKLGYESFKDSIEWTEGRGAASGVSKKRVLKDGTVSNITVGDPVQSGNVGFMDPSAMIRYCRKTAFARDYFDKFNAGIPFVEEVDRLYKELCPEHYRIQKNYAEGTNQNYVIGKTSFTTVTVNRNFVTAVHKDSGDLPQGFGNLVIYREGDWQGSYFVLPQYRIAFDVQNTDILFVDVHRWHGNTPYINFDADRGDLRIAFVLYYREYMIKCGTPTEELKRVKMDQGGFLRL